MSFRRRRDNGITARTLFAFSLVFPIPSIRKRKGLEKLRTKAVQEEFHGRKYPEGPFKQKYNWNSMNVSIWLPSLSELVGVTGTQHDLWGVYLSAMKGLTTSIDNYWIDAQGGAQFAYFKQYNVSGGGAAIMNACNQRQVWLRAIAPWGATAAWRTTDTQRFDTPKCTAACAVHPAVRDKFKVSFSLYPLISKIDKTGRSWERRPCERSFMEMGQVDIKFYTTGTVLTATFGSRV